MADLDDFFAKKDKKKKKKGARFSSAVLAEQLQSDVTHTEEVTVKPALNPTDVARPDDSEWIEINNDNLSDGLADLKIKSLESNKVEETEQIKEPETNDDDFVDEKKEDSTGPWAPVTGLPPKNTYTPSVPVQGNANVVGGKYIPPSQRNAAANTTPNNPGYRTREKLNVNSVEQFPDLSSAGRQKEKIDPSFDTVKATGRKNQQLQQTQSESVELNNKFKVLES